MQEVEAIGRAAEAENADLSAELRRVRHENDELRAELRRNETFYKVMETSYNETVQRWKILQANLDSFECKHKDEIKQAELECYRLKER